MESLASVAELAMACRRSRNQEPSLCTGVDLKPPASRLANHYTVELPDIMIIQLITVKKKGLELL